MPIEWVTIDALGKGWKDIERFIEGKCKEKNLTKTQEDELFALREWLKFSDQELAIPYDSIKDQMEKVAVAESPRPFTIPSTSSTIIRPFSVH